MLSWFPRSALAGRAIGALLFLLLPIVVCTVSLNAQTPASDGWEEQERDGITVLARENDRRSADRILDVAVVRAEEIAGRMALQTLAPLRIVVAPSHEEFRSLTSGGVPDWGVGCAFPSSRLVVLKSPRVVAYPLQMEDVIAHELAHIAVGCVLGDIWVPRWFHEGVALSMAGEWRLGSGRSVAAAAASGHLVPLGELERRFPEGATEAGLAYTESFQAVQYLLGRAGLGGAEDLVAIVAVARDFDAALAGIVPGGRSAFYEEVERFFAGRFSWGMLLTGWNPLFLLATLLFLVAVAVRVRHARRRLREWETEDGEEAGRAVRARRSSWE
jgi:hypothetical protein